MVLYGVYTIVATGLNLTSHTGWLPITMGAAAATNLVLNLVLIPSVGMIGAGVSTIAGYGLLAVTTGAVAQRHYRVEWDLGRVIASLGIAGALSAAALLGPDMLLWRLACIAAYPAAVVTLGVVDRRDIVRIGSAIRRRLPSA